MPGTLRVENLHDLQAGFAKLERDTRLEFRQGLRQVAEPVQRGAEQLAMSEIRNMSNSPRWSRMRVGVTRDLVYVAPRERGQRGRGGRHRPNLANLLMDRAMEPALEQHASEVEARFETLLDHEIDKFNTGGI